MLPHDFHPELARDMAFKSMVLKVWEVVINVHAWEQGPLTRRPWNIDLPAAETGNIVTGSSGNGWYTSEEKCLGMPLNRHKCSRTSTQVTHSNKGHGYAPSPSREQCAHQELWLCAVLQTEER